MMTTMADIPMADKKIAEVKDGDSIEMGHHNQIIRKLNALSKLTQIEEADNGSNLRDKFLEIVLLFNEIFPGQRLPEEGEIDASTTNKIIRILNSTFIEDM